VVGAERDGDGARKGLQAELVDPVLPQGRRVGPHLRKETTLGKHRHGTTVNLSEKRVMGRNVS